MFEITSKGDFDKTRKMLEKLQMRNLLADLHHYGAMGVAALAKATPVDENLTAQSWAYRIVYSGKWPGIEWYNTNVVNGTPVAILLQYGHGTGTGGYVPGRDFINPAIQPVMDQIAENVWRKVVTA